MSAALIIAGIGIGLSASVPACLWALWKARGQITRLRAESDTIARLHQTARIGNSVCPPVAAAIIRANLPITAEAPRAADQWGGWALEQEKVA